MTENTQADQDPKLNIETTPEGLTEAEYCRIQAEAHKAAFKKTWKTFLLTGLVTISTVVVLVISGIAWYANNRQVSARNQAVSSGSGPASLFIEAGDLTANTDYQSDYQYTTSVDTSLMSGNLYPVSMQPSGADISSAAWWYASTWTGAVCTGYTQAVPSQCTDSGKTDQYVYTNASDSHIYTAYNIANYTLYCSENGEMDVYFDPDDPISILSSTTGGAVPKQLSDAIRVGFVIDGELKFVYASAETGTGNSQGAASGAFYMVAGSSAISAPSYTILTNVGDYTAVQDADTDAYTAGTSTLCTTDHDGTVLSVYVWLEGTDAETTVGKSDNADGVSIQFNLVGIETEASGE